jgi:hypothetical protein
VAPLRPVSRLLGGRVPRPSSPGFHRPRLARTMGSAYCSRVVAFRPEYTSHPRSASIMRA